MLNSTKYRRVGRRRVIAAAGAVLAAPSIVRAQGQAGFALVIGNSKYLWEASLPNVRRDVADVARHLEAMGLRTELHENLGLDAMNKSLAAFGAKARGADFAVVYFAGHGVASGIVSGMVPVDVDLNDAASEKATVSTATVSTTMKNVAYPLMVFDNCRNNPGQGQDQRAEEARAIVFTDIAPHGSSLEYIRNYPNSVRIYSTAPGRVALDGPAGQNSPFAAAFMRQLEGESIDLQAFAGKVRRDLLIATAGQQLAWDVTAVKQPVLRPGTRGAATRPGSNRASATMVEFDKAYAFTQQNNLPLPAGLVGFRPSTNGHDSRKIGSFAFDLHGRPATLLVLSVDGRGAATTILAGSTTKSPYWRLMDATVAGDTLENDNSVGGTSWRYVFEWRDANSGKVSVLPKEGGKTKPEIGSFTRLDG